MYVLTVFCIFCSLFGLIPAQINNVCKRMLDYATLPVNPNCWYNHDVNSDTVDMVNRNGYPLEMYSLTTEDGYILSLYRIPHNNNKTNCSSSCRQPVYIQHGVQTTSEVWTDIGNRSMAFYLSDRCYDVWLGNFRGTPHSQTHVNYTTQDRQFWNYSFDEVGLYDIKANMDFIRKKSKSKCKIIYIGHSMGTTISYVYSILRNEEAEKNLAGLISLAPIGYVAGFRTPLRLAAPFWRQLYDILKALNLYGLIKNHFLQEAVASATCSQFYLMLPCEIALFLFQGFDFQKLLPQDVPLVFAYTPSGGAAKTLIHYLQEVNAEGQFQLYDYDKKNMEVYGSQEPPQYNVSEILIPVHLIYGRKDFLGTKVDVEHFYDELQVSEKSITELDYNHLDFMYAKDLETNLYPVLLEKIKSLECDSKCESS